MLNLNLLRCALGLSCALLLVVCPSLEARTRRGDKYSKQGREAEAQKLYTKALELYELALREDPTDTAYQLSVRRVRFQAGQMHVDLGQRLREAGQLEEALKEFQQAFAVDPSSVIAEQELRRTNEMIERKKAQPGKAEGPVLTPAQQARKQAEERMSTVMPLPELRPLSRQLNGLKMNNQPIRVLYDTVGKLAGINVMFDSEFQVPQGRNFSVDLNDTTLEEALDYLAVLTKTFWKPLSANTIFVTNDNVGKRRDYEDLVVKVFYLQNMTSVQELTEVATNIRAITDLRRIFNYNAQNALIVRGTADQVALAEKLIQDMDKPKAEVVVDVIVMETARGRTRELAASLVSGGQPGIKVPVLFTPRNPVLTGSNDGGGDGTTGGATTPKDALVSLARIGRISTNDFSITLPGGILSALMTDRSTNVLQSPQVRASDRMKASLRIGDRVPTATGSFQPGVGAIGVSPLVNTQFQFIEVGVNVDVTPTVHSQDEVTLHVELEISNVRDRIDLGGIQQPVIGQRKVVHDIRIKEGEVSLLGGLMQEQDTRNVSGVPGLASVPVLGRLFSSESKDKSQSELLIALVPHIVRTPDITDVNTRGISAGNETTVKLSFAPRPGAQAPAGTPAAAAQSPSAGVPVTAAQTQPPATQQPPAQSTPAAAGPSVSFSPGSAQAQLSDTLTVAVQAGNANDLFAAPMRIKFDPKVLRLIEIQPGAMFSGDGQQPNFTRDIRNEVGEASWNLNRLPGSSGVSGSGALAVMTFQVIGKGSTTVTTTEINLRNSQMQPLTATGPTMTISVP